MNGSKDHHKVAYCSSCREDRGRHTLRGSHSSSHGSRRRYLSNTYLEKRPIFEEKAQKHNSRGSDGHRGSIFDVFHHYIRLISLFQKGRDYTVATRQGEQPQEENGPLPLMSKGER
jgi:hypothetical protein